MAQSSTARLLALAFAVGLIAFPSRGEDVPDNLITNGGFEAGMQIWRGDGKIVLLPDGNRVCEVEASKSRMKDIKQEFHMKQLQQVEVVFRARSVGYDGPGIRVSIHQPGSGFIFWNKELPTDGSWKNFRVKYLRTTATMDTRELVISTFLGSGKVQYDDIEVREPGKSQENQTPEIAPPISPALNPAGVPAPNPAGAPAPNPAAVPAGAFGSLQDLVNSAPPETLLKLHDSATADAAIGELNAYFAQTARNKPLVVPIKANVIGAATDGHNAFRIGAFDTLVPGNGGLSVRLWAYFPPANAPGDGQVVKGSEVTVSGIIGRCDVTTKGGLRLNIDLQQSKIQAP